MHHLTKRIALALVVLSAAAWTGDAAAPALEAEPSSDGLLTWWLYSPVQKEPLAAAKPPLGAREDDVVAGTTGKWGLNIGAGRFVDFKPLLTGASGTLWASARIDSQTGGKRRLRGNTYCGLRVFRDGQMVLNKPQPTAPYADEAEAEIEIPKGVCELTVGVTIRQGFCGFQLSMAESNVLGGPARKAAGDKIVIPIAAGKTPDASAAVLKALTFGASDTFVRPGATVSLAGAMVGSIPCGLEPLSGRFLGPDGNAIGAALPTRAAAELVARGMWQAQYVVAQDIGVSQALTLEVKSGAKLLGTKTVELYSLAGLSAAAKTLESEIQARAAKSKSPLPHALAAAEKARLYVSKIENVEERIPNGLGAMLQDLLAKARRCADLEEQGKDPLEGQTGYLERAYISRIDEVAQPYFVMVPGAFAAKKAEKYPLVVFLHGYVPTYDKHRWWDEMNEFNSTFERNDAFMVIPFGRSNTDFQSCGEADVLDVIAEAKRLYPIDSDRVYLYGYSMGGMAVYHLGAHNPDTFAAAIVMAGRADSPLQNKQPLAKFHPYKQWLIHVDNPISLCEDFTNIPLRIFHGKGDFIISVDEARRMEARLQELGCDAKLTVMPGDHFFGFDVMTTDEPLKWLLTQKRAVAPAKARIKAYSLKYARQGPVAVTATTGDLQPIEVEWTQKDGAVTVTRVSDNVLQYTVNGKPAKQFEAQGLRKTPRCAGPIRDAITAPFVIVYGTSGAPEANARNQKTGEQFAKEWFDFTRSRAILKADKDVTDAEKQSKNLFLIGEEQENLLHAAAAKNLPFAVKDGQATIAGKTVPLAGKGLMYVYPSPFRGAGAEPVVVICAGLPYGREVGNNHKFDLLPDFILYDDKVDQDSTSTNRFVCAGFFNGEWKVDEKQMWWAEK